jgi:hypothetical protein
MPYPFTHPAAAIPLNLLLGRLAVPSALAIGSVVPDLWYLAYFVDRGDSHSAAGLLWFCLPFGFLLYAGFHLIFKQPLIALMPACLAARLGAWTFPGLPRVPWHAVLVCLFAGALVHLVWDEFTHRDMHEVQTTLLAIGRYQLQLHQLLQHLSTLLGSVFLAWWLWRKLRASPSDSSSSITVLPMPLRTAILAALLIISADPLWHGALGISTATLADISAVRTMLRGAAISGLSAFGLGLVTYCLLWRIGGMTRQPHAQATTDIR